MCRRAVGVLIAIASIVLSAHSSAKPGSQGWQGADHSPTPLDYFRRADHLTNIRMPGSAPFHMKVTFHAYPAIDLNPPRHPAKPSTAPLPGHPFVLSGDGTYEETWLAPNRWRREVTFGSYHAVEIRADGVRKMQASSDYEPGRVLMLMDALLQPIHRWALEPELQSHPWKWKLEHLEAGSIPYVRVSHIVSRGQNDFGSVLEAFEFLPSGVLVRQTEHGWAISWQDDVPFAGKLVPHTIHVRSMEGKLLDAEISMEPLSGTPAPSRFDLPVGPADPGSSLEYLPPRSRESSGPAHADSPAWPPEYDAPPGAGIRVSATLDRTGIPREMEFVAAWPQSSPDGHLPAWLRKETEMVFRSIQHSRYPPPTVDNSPCESFVVADEIHGLP